MKLRKLMTSDVVTIGPDASLKEAARRMLTARVSGLVVTSEDGELLGVITEADFVKAEADRRSQARAGLLRWFTRDSEITSGARTVGDVMSSPVVTLEPDSDHTEAARTMRIEGVKRIPIVDEDDRLIGIVSRADIMRALVRPDSDIIDVIKNQIMREVMWIDPALVDLGCVDGDVTMSGRLETRSDAELLLELARRVDGVISVKSDLSWAVDNRKVPHHNPVLG